MTRKNLSQSHPVHHLIRTAAYYGNPPSQAELDRLNDYDATLPEGSSIARFRRQIAAAADECAAISRTGAQADARNRADQLIGDLSEAMTTEEAAIDRDPNPEPLSSITARMFHH